eukprot:13242947-Alexandrium_andersonii.AAC.1
MKWSPLLALRVATGEGAVLRDGYAAAELAARARRPLRVASSEQPTRLRRPCPCAGAHWAC